MNTGYITILENFIEDYEFDVDCYLAVEADLAKEKDTEDPNALSTRLRRATNEYREASKTNDIERMAKAKAEINSIVHDIEAGNRAAQKANSPKKADWEKLAKYALAAITVIAGAAVTGMATKAARNGGVPDNIAKGNGNGRNVVVNIGSNNAGENNNLKAQGFSFAFSALRKILHI